MPSPSEIYRSDLRFLLKLKEAVGILHNRIHDNLAQVAILQFEVQFPELSFQYLNAGAAGIDICGTNAAGELRFIAEVKTTLPDIHGRIRGPQIKQLKKDLERLCNHDGDLVRYLVLLSASTVEAVRRQIKTDRDFPAVQIFNALDDDLRESVPAGR